MDREELLALYPAQRDRLLASLSRLVGATDAEDLANDTLLRALAAAHDFRGDAALSTWLHRIGVNLAYDLLRRRSRNAELATPDDSDRPDAAHDALAGDRLEQRQMSRCVRNLLAQLPPAQREVLAQADMFEQSVSEIARDAGISTGNAKIRLHRARRAMRAVLESHCTLAQQESGVLCCQPKTASIATAKLVSSGAPRSSKRGTTPVRHKETHDA